MKEKILRRTQKAGVKAGKEMALEGRKKELRGIDRQKKEVGKIA